MLAKWNIRKDAVWNDISWSVKEKEIILIVDLILKYLRN